MGYVMAVLGAVVAAVVAAGIIYASLYLQLHEEPEYSGDDDELDEHTLCVLDEAELMYSEGL